MEREEHLPISTQSQQRPGDVALDMGSGRTLVDITVANPFSATRTHSNAGSPAVAAEIAYDRKVDKYRETLRECSDFYTFQPLAVTAMGVWDERSLRWLRRFSDVCAAATSQSPGWTFSKLMIFLSVALWRGNSAMLRAARAPGPF